MMAILSAMAMASRWSWVTYTVVAPRRSCRARNSRHISSRNSASSAPSGSSIMKASGWRTMARPSATRWRSPLVKPETEDLSKCVICSVAAACATRVSISARGMPCDTSGKAMFWRTDICGYSANIWNTNAISRAEARLNVTSSPPKKICPSVGNSSPAIMRRVVVLPQPEGPSRQKNSPSLTTKDESFTATKSPKALRSC